MKQEDSHFVFKLVSGEEVIALTTMDDSGIEPCFYLADPLKVELSHKGNHTTTGGQMVAEYFIKNKHQLKS